MRLGNTTFSSAVLHMYLPSLLMTLGQGMIIPALPAIGQAFGVPGALAVQVITAQLVGRFLALMPTGVIVDRWGAKLPMVVGAAVSAITGLASAFAPHFLVLMALQFCWGLGMSMWMFGREIAAVDMVRADQRGRQMSALMGIGATGSALGPAIGGVLTEPVGARGLFLVYAITAGIVLIISAYYRDSSVRRPRKPGGLFSVKRIGEIHPYFRLTYIILFLATFSVMVRNQVTNSMMPLYTQEQIGYSPATTGFLFTIMGITTFAMIVPGGVISDKFGRKFAAAPATLFSAAGFLLLPFAQGIPALFVASVILGLANGLALGSMTTFTFDIVPEHSRGQLQAMRRTIGEIGAVVGPPISGMVAVTMTPSASFLVWVPLFLLSGFLLTFVAKESLHKKRPPGAPGAPARHAPIS